MNTGNTAHMTGPKKISFGPTTTIGEYTRMATCKSSVGQNTAHIGCMCFSGTHVDDLLITGVEDFERSITQLDSKIKMKSRVDTLFVFSGLRINRVEEWIVILDQVA